MHRKTPVYNEASAYTRYLQNHMVCDKLLNLVNRTTYI